MCMWPGYPIPGIYISSATIFMRYHENAPAICKGAQQMANSLAMVIVWLYFSYILLIHLGNFLSEELLYLTLVTRAIKVMRPWLLSHEIFIKSSHVITYSEWQKKEVVWSIELTQLGVCGSSGRGDRSSTWPQKASRCGPGGGVTD